MRVARRKSHQRSRDVRLHKRRAVAAKRTKHRVLDGDARVRRGLFQPTRHPMIVMHHSVLVHQQRPLPQTLRHHVFRHAGDITRQPDFEDDCRVKIVARGQTRRADQPDLLLHSRRQGQLTAQVPDRTDAAPPWSTRPTAPGRQSPCPPRAGQSGRLVSQITRVPAVMPAPPIPRRSSRCLPKNHARLVRRVRATPSVAKCPVVVAITPGTTACRPNTLTR